jgi:hypothetical protein
LPTVVYALLFVISVKVVAVSATTAQVWVLVAAGIFPSAMVRVLNQVPDDPAVTAVGRGTWFA